MNPFASTGARLNSRITERSSDRLHPKNRFCDQGDQPRFDPRFSSMPLETFVPMVRRVFAPEPFKHGNGRERTGAD